MHVSTLTKNLSKANPIQMVRDGIGKIFPMIKNHEDVFIHPLIALLLAFIFMNTPFFQIGKILENLTVELRYKARAPFDPPADDHLAILGIDEQSIEEYGRWPWDRSIFSTLLDTVARSPNKEHPVTISFDVVFSDATKVFKDGQRVVDTAPDQALGDACGNLAGVITGSLLDILQDPNLEAKAEKKTAEALADPGYTTPITKINGNINIINGAMAADLPVDQLRKNSLFGFVDATPSKLDGIRWTVPMVVRLQNKLYPSLALQTVLWALQINPDNVTVNVGDNITLVNDKGKVWIIPITPNGEIWVNYRRDSSYNALTFVGVAQTLKYHFDSVQQHAADGKTPILPLPEACNLSKKIVLIGQVAEGLADIGPSPLSPQTPLVFTHMNIINSILKEDYVKFVPWYFVAIGFLLVSWGTLYPLRKASVSKAIGIPGAITVAYIAIAFGLFAYDSLVIDIAWPVLFFVALHLKEVIRRWIEEQKSKKELKSLFSRMVAPEVLNHLLDKPETLKLGGSTRACTIFFSDIRDYTKISEGMDNEELVRQLNIYFERMVDCMLKRKGTFHKFIGDAIMCSWSAIEAVSEGVEKDALNAVLACLDMRRELITLNVERKQQGLIPLRIGIGLNHGTVLAGQIGAPNSVMEFTLMGDAVNTASRLEGMTKYFTTDMVIGESVYNLIGDAVIVRRMGKIVLKGKTKPMMVLEIVADRNLPETASFPLDSLAIYNDALDAFYTRRFQAAMTGFGTLLPLHPKDYCIKHYYEESQTFMTTPPPEAWDGRIVLTEK